MFAGFNSAALSSTSPASMMPLPAYITNALSLNPNPVKIHRPLTLFVRRESHPSCSADNSARTPTSHRLASDYRRTLQFIKIYTWKSMVLEPFATKWSAGAQTMAPIKSLEAANFHKKILYLTCLQPRCLPLYSMKQKLVQSPSKCFTRRTFLATNLPGMYCCPESLSYRIAFSARITLKQVETQKAP